MSDGALAHQVDVFADGVLGAADEQEEPSVGTVEAWGRSKEKWLVWPELCGRFGLYVPPLFEALGTVELEHNAKNNRVKAK